jgi:hypothetical protein
VILFFFSNIYALGDIFFINGKILLQFLILIILFFFRMSIKSNMIQFSYSRTASNILGSSYTVAMRLQYTWDDRIMGRKEFNRSIDKLSGEQITIWPFDKLYFGQHLKDGRALVSIKFSIVY